MRIMYRMVLLVQLLPCITVSELVDAELLRISQLGKREAILDCSRNSIRNSRRRRRAYGTYLSQ